MKSIVQSLVLIVLLSVQSRAATFEMPPIKSKASLDWLASGDRRVVLLRRFVQSEASGLRWTNIDVASMKVKCMGGDLVFLKQSNSNESDGVEAAIAIVQSDKSQLVYSGRLVAMASLGRDIIKKLKSKPANTACPRLVYYESTLDGVAVVENELVWSIKNQSYTRMRPQPATGVMREFDYSVFRGGRCIKAPLYRGVRLSPEVYLGARPECSVVKSREALQSLIKRGAYEVSCPSPGEGELEVKDGRFYADNSTCGALYQAPVVH